MHATTDPGRTQGPGRRVDADGEADAELILADVAETEAILAAYWEGVLEETRRELREQQRAGNPGEAGAREGGAEAKKKSKAAKRKQEKRKAQQQKRAAEVTEAAAAAAVEGGAGGGEVAAGQQEQEQQAQQERSRKRRRMARGTKTRGRTVRKLCRPWRLPCWRWAWTRQRTSKRRKRRKTNARCV